MAKSMLQTQDAKDFFGEALNDNASFIEKIYDISLNKGKGIDTDGKAYWTKALNGGGYITDSTGKTIHVGALNKEGVVGGILGALNRDNAVKTDQQTFHNKVSVSDYFADISVGRGNIGGGKHTHLETKLAMIASKTKSDNLDTIKAEIDSLIATMPSAPETKPIVPNIPIVPNNLGHARVYQADNFKNGEKIDFDHITQRELNLETTKYNSVAHMGQVLVLFNNEDGKLFKFILPTENFLSHLDHPVDTYIIQDNNKLGEFDDGDIIIKLVGMDMEDVKINGHIATYEQHDA